MSPILTAGIIGAYFFVLIFISFFTSKERSNLSFFAANRQSPWYLVAFGMIGASLSGVTFISIPGEVGTGNWYYFQIVLGYIVGYLVIGIVLLPLYYKLNLISIYGYLEQRFGFWAYKSGAFFFILSRMVGASFRMFLVAGVLQITLFNALGLPFWLAVVSSVGLIWLYTFRGGIKTIVWTDTLQTAFMLLAVVISIDYMRSSMELSWSEMLSGVWQDSRSNIFNWEWQHSRNFFKQFLSGAFIAIVMTGLDQDMMQKNLTCRNLEESQKNMFWFTITLVFVNLLFLTMGVLLFQFAEFAAVSIPARTDGLFPLLATQHFSLLAGLFFILGITAAAYSSADSALTALTTSFCIDIIGLDISNDASQKIRIWVHIGFSILMVMVILGFNSLNDQTVISSIFTAAGYTYGPLLGLFTVGIFTKWKLNDRLVPFVCLIAPILSWMINLYGPEILGGYRFGFEILLVNGLLTILGLWAIKKA